jgi:hypothetical protein
LIAPIIAHLHPLTPPPSISSLLRK